MLVEHTVHATLMAGMLGHTCFVKSDLGSEITAATTAATNGVHLRGKGLGVGQLVVAAALRELEAGSTCGLDEHAMCSNATRTAPRARSRPPAKRAVGGERSRVSAVRAGGDARTLSSSGAVCARPERVLVLWEGGHFQRTTHRPVGGTTVRIPAAQLYAD